ncbi:hypothetical protein Acr_15g0016410 [Actinidia rufa]|uniref:Uncharacterized protein n=1 Tax=Actinidia rufa TaxID=165716 RepID=A0A7J0FWG9_9ERIC|nr:hypothetical protein Acr_15g0016410 [Actinidia rufa]
MTAQKRSQDGPPEEDDGSLQRHLNLQERTEDNEETDGSGSSTDGDKDEYVFSVDDLSSFTVIS